MTDDAVDRWLEISAAVYDQFVRLHRRLLFDVVDLDVDDLAALHVAHHRPTPTVCRTSRSAGSGVDVARREQVDRLRRHIVSRADVLVGRTAAASTWLQMVAAERPDPAHWRRAVHDVYAEALATADAGRTNGDGGPGVVQVMEALDIGDGVSEIVRRNARILGRLGQPDHVLSLYAHPEVSTAVRPLHAGQSAEALIFHLWGPHGAGLAARRVPRTEGGLLPQHYATALLRSRHELAHIDGARVSSSSPRADSFDLALAPSRYDLDDFMAYRTRPVPGVVVPPVVDAAELTAEPSDERWCGRCDVDGSVNIVFVGRLTPNKCQHRLVDLFEFYSREINPNSRLWLVGSDRDAVYSSEVRSRIQRSPVRHRIVVTGHVSRAHLLAYLRGCRRLRVCIGARGFGIPLAQAMAFDVPVVALGRAGVPETMGGTGVVVDDWDVSGLRRWWMSSSTTRISGGWSSPVNAGTSPGSRSRRRLGVWRRRCCSFARESPAPISSSSIRAPSPSRRPASSRDDADRDRCRDHVRPRAVPPSPAGIARPARGARRSRSLSSTAPRRTRRTISSSATTAGSRCVTRRNATCRHRGTSASRPCPETSCCSSTTMPTRLALIGCGLPGAVHDGPGRAPCVCGRERVAPRTAVVRVRRRSGLVLRLPAVPGHPRGASRPTARRWFTRPPGGTPRIDGRHSSSSAGSMSTTRTTPTRRTWRPVCGALVTDAITTRTTRSATTPRRRTADPTITTGTGTSLPAATRTTASRTGSVRSPSASPRWRGSRRGSTSSRRSTATSPTARSRASAGSGGGASGWRVSPPVGPWLDDPPAHRTSFVERRNPSCPSPLPRGSADEPLTIALMSEVIRDSRDVAASAATRSTWPSRS